MLLKGTLSFFYFLFFNGLEVSVGWENHKESGLQRNVLSRGEELGCWKVKKGEERKKDEEKEGERTGMLLHSKNGY